MAMLTVARAAVEAVTVTSVWTALTVGESTQLRATALAAGGTVLSDRAISWSTSNGSVATVSASGQVTAIAVSPANHNLVWAGTSSGRLYLFDVKKKKVYDMMGEEGLKELEVCSCRLGVECSLGEVPGSETDQTSPVSFQSLPKKITFFFCVEA